jgi:hypothetical protein
MRPEPKLMNQRLVAIFKVIRLQCRNAQLLHANQPTLMTCEISQA